VTISEQDYADVKSLEPEFPLIIEKVNEIIEFVDLRSLLIVMYALSHKFEEFLKSEGQGRDVNVLRHLSQRVEIKGAAPRAVSSV